LIAELNDVSADENTRAVLLTGTGKVFCSGANFKSILESDLAPVQHLDRMLLETYHPLIGLLTNMPVPVVAAVNGAAIGGGVTLALATDIVFAKQSATFAIRFLQKLGAVPDTGSSWLFARVLGPSRALALTATGEPISAQDAERIGLIWKAVPDAEFRDKVLGCAQQLARLPMQAFARTRALLRQAHMNTLGDHMEWERQQQLVCFAGAEVDEALSAVRERREPDFTKLDSPQTS
jgi:2-(1,2-epoxy-1,2-dihydrophenyl)acetyl-CoA isomerase